MLKSRRDGSRSSRWRFLCDGHDRVPKTSSQDRLRPSSAGDDRDTRAILKQALTQCRPVNTEEQPIAWSGRRWLASQDWHSTTKARIAALCDQLDLSKSAEELVITRRDVFDRRGDAVDLFIAAMAWGFGMTGYGGWRTAAMVNPEGREQEQQVADAVDAYRAAWSTGGAEAVARAWSNGRGKIRGLGPAFASKLAYFAIYDRTAGVGPLIADLNTTWSVWALGGIWDSRYEPGKYLQYVQWCERWAQALGRRSDDIERVLFNLGPAVRRDYRELKEELTRVPKP
jgi:hypothetical protein